MVASPEHARHEDAAQLRLACAGDQAAFLALYRRHVRAVHRFALHMSGSAALADEVAQEVFLAMVTNASGYDAARGPLIAFLLGIARHRVRRHSRRAARDVTLEEGARDRQAPAQDPLEQLARARTVAAVRGAVIGLPVRYREVVVLCDLQELPYADAAAVLGCPIGTVRSRLARGRRLLAKKLEALGCSARDALMPVRVMT